MNPVLATVGNLVTGLALALLLVALAHLTLLVVARVRRFHGDGRARVSRATHRARQRGPQPGGGGPLVRSPHPEWWVPVQRDREGRSWTT